MRFAHGKGEVYAEKVADGQRFVLKPWQYEMMRRFDGKRTFEEIAREIYEQFRGEFSAVGLTNFYQWLYDENLVLCECESIFELVPEEGAKASAPQPPQEYAAPLARHKGISQKIQKTVREGFGPPKDWQKKAIRVSAIVLFCLAVLRIAYVSAPILEPPVDHVYSSVEDWFYHEANMPSERRAINEVRETPVQEMELAGRVTEMPVPQAMPIEADPVVSHEAIPEPAPLEATPEDLERLRREMAECRIRRDEFYLQNNEIGYRYEVQKMTALAKQIGEIEAQLD
ncbi:MAG: hypothetical protein AAGF67_04460 [Verrucomicrobiota bacterium]